jgi:hypothetical protein
MSSQQSQRSSPPSALSNRRRRAPIACRLCRKRKIKVRPPFSISFPYSIIDNTILQCITDENPPHGPCERCTRKNLTCEYVPVGDEDMLSNPPLTPTSPMSNTGGGVPLHPTFPSQYSHDGGRHDSAGLPSQYGYPNHYLPGNQGHAVYGYETYSPSSQLDNNYSSYNAIPSGLATYPPTSGPLSLSDPPSGMQNAYHHRPGSYSGMSGLDQQQGWSPMSSDSR